MSIIHIGHIYQKFLETNLKPYNVIKNNDGFNLSMISLSGIDKHTDSDFLVHVRYNGVLPAYFGEEVIPGNYSSSESYIKNKLNKANQSAINKIKFGKNFIWNNWGETSTPIDNLVLFVASIKNKQFKVIENIKPIAYTNIPVYIKDKLAQHKYADVRLFRIDNKIFMYDGSISGIFEILLLDNQLHCSIKMDTSDPFYKQHRLYYNRNFCGNIKEFDKNWAFVEPIQEGRTTYYTFLNWYERNSVSMSYIDKNPVNKPCVKKLIIKQNKDIISGLDPNFETGMFSFGSPFLPLSRTDTSYEGVAVGHIKIMYTSHKYKNPILTEFLKKVDELNKSDTFISHTAYYYLMYYIHLKRKNDKYEMFISDSYLYVPKDSTKYKFSLNYPMSINKYGKSEYVISMGIGDYYTYLLYMSANDIIKKCKHNVAEFDLSKYKYILEYV